MMDHIYSIWKDSTQHYVVFLLAHLQHDQKPDAVFALHGAPDTPAHQWSFKRYDMQCTTQEDYNAVILPAILDALHAEPSADLEQA